MYIRTSAYSTDSGLPTCKCNVHCWSNTWFQRIKEDFQTQELMMRYANRLGRVPPQHAPPDTVHWCWTGQYMYIVYIMIQNFSWVAAHVRCPDNFSRCLISDCFRSSWWTRMLGHLFELFCVCVHFEPLHRFQLWRAFRCVFMMFCASWIKTSTD